MIGDANRLEAEKERCVDSCNDQKNTRVNIQFYNLVSVVAVSFVENAKSEHDGNTGYLKQYPLGISIKVGKFNYIFIYPYP